MPEAPDLPRIVVVDDDAELREMIVEYLGGQGFSMRSVAGGEELNRALADEPADLLIVDLNLPVEDGFSIARRIRATSGIPIVMLTGVSDVVDRIVGLEIGADDYVTKPFDLRELKARISAVLRRRGGRMGLNAGATTASDAPASAIAKAGEKKGNIVPFGRVHLDLEGHCLVLPDGSRDTLTAMEFDLLKVLAQNPNRVLTRDRLLDLAHKRDNEPFDRSIDVRVTRLRKKIEDDPANPATIKTVRGVGYVFVTSRNA